MSIHDYLEELRLRGKGPLVEPPAAAKAIGCTMHRQPPPANGLNGIVPATVEKFSLHGIDMGDGASVWSALQWHDAKPPSNGADGFDDGRLDSLGKSAKPLAPFARIINPADWEGLPIPDRKWIVPGYVPHMTVTMLSGDGGQGKSLLALQLAVAMALAREWIGLLPEPGRTLVLSAEDDGDEMQRRLDWIRKFHGAAWADLADIRLIDLAGENSTLGSLTKGQIEPTEMYRTLDAFMAEWKPSLTTLDVLADMFAGQENDRSQVRQFINLLKGLARKHRSAILLLAHPSLAGMNTGTGLSGSTDWNNGVRARLYFQTPKTDSGEPLNKNLRTLEGMKSNYGERGGKLDLEWKNGLFVPVSVQGGFDKLAAEQKADDVFMNLVAMFKREGRDVSPNAGTTFAPAIFAAHTKSDGITKVALRAYKSRAQSVPLNRL